MEAEAQFQPGERITHHEFGQGVVLDPARDGYLRAFFGVGERRVPIGAVRRQLSRTERILRAVDGGAQGVMQLGVPRPQNQASPPSNHDQVQHQHQQ